MRNIVDFVKGFTSNCAEFSISVLRGYTQAIRECGNFGVANVRVGCGKNWFWEARERLTE